MSPRRDRVLAAADEIARASALEEVRAIAARVRARAESGAPSAVAVVGRRGAGKSSLLAAMRDEPLRPASRPGGDDPPRAMTLPAAPGWIAVDAPGFRGGTDWMGASAALRAWAPAATVFVVPATEVDAIDDDAAALEVFLGSLPRGRRRCLAVVNKVDELDPVDDHVPPFRHARKGFHIAEAAARARWNLARRGIETVDVVPLSALVVRRGAAVLHDGRWNLAAFASALNALARETPGAWGVEALRDDLAALARAYADEACAREDAPTEAAADRVARLLGVAGGGRGAGGWSRGLLGPRFSLRRLAATRPDADLGFRASAPGEVAPVDDDGAAGR